MANGCPSGDATLVEARCFIQALPSGLPFLCELAAVPPHRVHRAAVLTGGNGLRRAKPVSEKGREHYGSLHSRLRLLERYTNCRIAQLA